MNTETRAALVALKEEVQLMLAEDADPHDNHHGIMSNERILVLNAGQLELGIELAVQKELGA